MIDARAVVFGLSLCGAAVIAGLLVRQATEPPQPPRGVGALTATSAANTQRQPCTLRAGGALQDPRCTPGAVNLHVTQTTIRQTICKPGWAASVRPPVTTTEPWKFRAMRAYGIDTTPGHAQLYEYDHLIPIELGGAVLDTRNLFPEPRHVQVAAADEGSFAKDQVENRLKREVCATPPVLTLAKARQAIRTDWRTAP